MGAHHLRYLRRAQMSAPVPRLAGTKKEARVGRPISREPLAFLALVQARKLRKGDDPPQPSFISVETQESYDALQLSHGVCQQVLYRTVSTGNGAAVVQPRT